MFSFLTKDGDAPVHQKYQFKPRRGSSHWWALQHLLGSVKGKAILDVGAGGGGIGRSIRPEGPKQLIAVEPDTRSHGLLSESYDQVVADINLVNGQRFDWIIILDVLEHLTNPVEFLSTLRDLLNPGGSILISVPNIAHWSVRFPLFFLGRFEYQTRGIMDGTHLSFFSRRRLHRICKGLPDIEIQEAAASIEPFELMLPGVLANNVLYRSLTPLRLWFAKTFPGLMAYQHLVWVKAELSTPNTTN